MSFEFEKTPEEKANHAAAQFGTGSLYTKSLRVLADLFPEVGFEKALQAAESFASFKLNQKAIQKKKEIEARNRS